MKANSVSTGSMNLLVIGLGILAALLVFATLTGRRMPLLASDRAALLALVIIGMAMCSQSIARVAATGAWLHPLSILAYLLGGVVLLIGIAALFERQVPLLASYYQSIAAVAVIAAVKVLITGFHRLFP